MIDRLYYSFILEFYADVYKACDQNGDGLDHDDFRTSACFKAWSVTGLSITEFLWNVDTDGDGRVLFREMVEHLIP